MTKTVAMTTEGLGHVDEVDGEEQSSADEWVTVDLPQGNSTCM